MSVYFKGQFKAPRETKVKLFYHLSIFSSHIWSGHLYQKSQLLCPFKEWAGLIQVLSMYFPLKETEYILVYGLFQANTSFVTFTCFTGPRSAVRRVLTAGLGVASSIPARSHTFMEIDHEIISKVIFLFPLNHS